MTAPSTGAVGDARKRDRVTGRPATIYTPPEDVERVGDAEWTHHDPAVRALIAEAVQAERERIAVEFEEMGDVWGGDAAWLTTGNRIAALAADVARDGGR